MKGIDAVETSLKGAIDSDTLTKLEKLMNEGDGFDWFRGCLENSFAPDTFVLMADGGRKPIEQIAPGDKVLAGDPVNGIVGGRTVTALHRNLDTDLADLTISDGSGEQAILSTTQRHPFWSDTAKNWVYAGDLAPEDRLRTADDSGATVADVRPFTGLRTMVNLTVDDLHTYYVFAGERPVLVHNCPTIGGGPTGTPGGTPPRQTIPIWRTPKKADKDFEEKHGPNPASHTTGDQKVYLGEESVAAEYQGRGDFANGMIRYDVDLEKFFELIEEWADKGPDKILNRYDRQGPNGSDRMEFVVPADLIDRLNDMTVKRTWIPKS